MRSCFASVAGCLWRLPNRASPFLPERAVSKFARPVVCALITAARSVRRQRRNDCVAHVQADGAVFFPAEHFPADMPPGAGCMKRAAENVVTVILKNSLGENLALAQDCFRGRPCRIN